MRNLTIVRRKKYTGCLAKVRFYIEDPVEGELDINGVSCRKLGEVKNGETKTFQIGNGAARVYAIYDKSSRGYCNDYYPVEAGEEDVTLSGACKLGGGNPFRFDGVTDEDALKNRKKGSKKGWLVMIAAIIIGYLVGGGCTSALLDSASNEPKTFTTDAGMTITLTEAFQEAEYEGFTACFESTDVAVFTLQEPFTLMEGLEDYTLEEYGELLIEANGRPATLNDCGDFMWFEYTVYNSELGGNVWYYVTVHKSADAFWLIQFGAMQEVQEEYAATFEQWADSVTFAGP